MYEKEQQYAILGELGRMAQNGATTDDLEVYLEDIDLRYVTRLREDPTIVADRLEDEICRWQKLIGTIYALLRAYSDAKLKLLS